MVFKYAFLIPIFLSVGMCLTCLATYLIALHLDHIHKIFPYISDTGTIPPTSCIFGLLLNTGALMLFAVFYVRYRQIRQLRETDSISESMAKLNTVSFYIGIIVSYAVLVVANFQETNLFIVHLSGAFGSFGLGCIYQIMQVFVSFAVFPKTGRKWINVVRAICAVISNISFQLSIIYGILSTVRRIKGDSDFDMSVYVVKWYDTDPGYIERIISAAAEWMLMVSTMLFLLTFTLEFKPLHFKEPEIILMGK